MFQAVYTEKNKEIKFLKKKYGKLIKQIKGINAVMYIILKNRAFCICTDLFENFGLNEIPAFARRTRSQENSNKIGIRHL